MQYDQTGGINFYSTFLMDLIPFGLWIGIPTSEDADAFSTSNFTQNTNLMCSLPG